MGLLYAWHTQYCISLESVESRQNQTKDLALVCPFKAQLNSAAPFSMLLKACSLITKLKLRLTIVNYYMYIYFCAKVFVFSCTCV